MQRKINIVPFLFALTMVPVGGNLQQILNSAQPGDEIVLPGNSTFVGSYTLPKKDGTATITLRSESPMAKILSPGQNEPALTTAPGAANYLIKNIEFGKVSPDALVTNLILLGTGSETSVSAEPSHITLDGIYAHGDANSDLRRCIALNGSDLNVLNSRVEECHQKGSDSQAIAGWNGPGPFTIKNNTLEAASENILFGGADPKISNLIPSDITISGNTITKDTAWKGKGFVVKNLIEFKNAKNVTVSNNTFSNVWTDGQTGTAILVKSANQDGACTWCISEHIAFSHNTITNAEEGVRINAAEGSPLPPKAHDISFSGDAFTNISGKLFQVFGGVDNVTIDGVTGSADTGILFADTAANPGLTLTNSVFGRGTYGVGAGSEEGLVYLNKWFPDSTFSGNTIINNSSLSNSKLAAAYGSGFSVVSPGTKVTPPAVSSPVSSPAPSATPSASEDVTPFVPTETVSSPSPQVSSGGGGGGGGGASPSVVSNSQDIASLKAQLLLLTLQLAKMQGPSASTPSSGTAAVSSVSNSSSQDLTLGSTGPNVTALQEMLVSQGYLTMPAGVDYGYFGPLTQSALAAWQKAHGISPAVGYWGPLSRAAQSSGQ